MKQTIISIAIAVAIAGCSKDENPMAKCTVCETTNTTYVDGDHWQSFTVPVDCEVSKPGTTVRRSEMAFGKVLLTVSTTKCVQ